MQGCLFCKIIDGESPCDKVYEDDQVLAFRDIAPQAPVHALVIPKQHVAHLTDAQQLSDVQLGYLLRTCAQVAEKLGLDKTGYRVVTNCGEHSAQSVHHLHLHVIGGAQLSGKMALLEEK